MEITEKQVIEYMEALKKSDPVLAYIIGTFGEAIKSHASRISATEQQEPAPNC